MIEGAAVGELGRARAMRLERIDHPDQADIRQPRQHARVVAAHHASADDADPKRVLSQLGFRTRSELPGTHVIDPNQIKRHTPRCCLARRHKCGECRNRYPDTI